MKQHCTLHHLSAYEVPAPRSLPSCVWGSDKLSSLACLQQLLRILCCAEFGNCCAAADERSGPAVLAAYAARRWLARNAAGVRRARSAIMQPAAACMSLVCCLPALEDVELCIPGTPDGGGLGCLLEALAWCPRLRALDLCIMGVEDRGGDAAPFPADATAKPPFPAGATAKLRSLTKLALAFFDADPFFVADMVGALVPLTGLAELRLCSPRCPVVPAVLGQLKALRSLELQSFGPGVLEAGCFDLPRLQSLAFLGCDIEAENAEVLPGLTALQSLTRMKFVDGKGPPIFAQLVQLPRLQSVAFNSCEPIYSGPRLGLPVPPATLCSLSTALLHLDVTGRGLTHFPLALTQLVGLECLKADNNKFAELPAGITALSRLTKLILGRECDVFEDPLQEREKRPLDARALGDLSGLPVLRELTFKFCEVMLCQSLPGAVRHASLAALCFGATHPAPECAPVVLQLSQALRRLGRGSVLRLDSRKRCGFVGYALEEAQGRAPFQRFQAAIEACGP